MHITELLEIGLSYLNKLKFDPTKGTVDVTLRDPPAIALACQIHKLYPINNAVFIRDKGFNYVLSLIYLQQKSASHFQKKFK